MIVLSHAHRIEPPRVFVVAHYTLLLGNARARAPCIRVCMLFAMTTETQTDTKRTFAVCIHYIHTDVCIVPFGAGWYSHSTRRPFMCPEYWVTCLMRRLHGSFNAVIVRFSRRCFRERCGSEFYDVRILCCLISIIITIIIRMGLPSCTSWWWWWYGRAKPFSSNAAKTIYDRYKIAGVRVFPTGY